MTLVYVVESRVPWEGAIVRMASSVRDIAFDEAEKWCAKRAKELEESIWITTFNDKGEKIDEMKVKQ